MTEGYFSEGHRAVVLVLEAIDFCSDTHDALIRAEQRHPDSILGCQVVNGNASVLIQDSGWSWSQQTNTWEPTWYMEVKRDLSTSNDKACMWVSPEAFLIPRTAWQKVGPFTSNMTYPLAVIDWCLRASSKGVKSLLIRDALVSAPPKAPNNNLPTGDTVRGILILAHRHNQPYGFIKLASRLYYHALLEEWSMINFGADYGRPVAHYKRFVWYIYHLLCAFKRKKPLSVFNSLRDVLAMQDTE